jgi:hypothetical protein
VPFDDEGYVEAFTYDQEKEIQAFFDKFGFVVIRDVLAAPGTFLVRLNFWVW